MASGDGTQSTERPYHHGRLREALVDAGFELARTDGPEAVVLRAVTRATGVSHNAAYRHFADHGELLQAVALRCMGELAQLMQQRTAEVTATDAVDRAWGQLRAIGRAYIEFAVREPGLFRTAFTALPDPSKHVAQDGAAPGPYELLGAQLDRLVQVGAIPAERRPGAEFAAWSAVHGLSALFVAGPLVDLPEPERARAVDVVLSVVERGL